MKQLWEVIKSILSELEQLFTPTYEQDMPPEPQNSPPSPVSSNPDALLPWTTKDNCRHNVRALADLEGLTVAQKNLMSQVIHCESDYQPNVVMYNCENGQVRRERYSAEVFGKILSIDSGIAQWNNLYHGKEISTEDAEHNPEMAVRLMCKYVKTGRISQWVCYSKGLYKNYSS